MVVNTSLLDQLLSHHTLPSYDHLARYRELIQYEYVGDTREIWESHLKSAPKSIFLCHAVLKTIDACLAKSYICFDAHTTSNCCHGIALLVKDLILSTKELDLPKLRGECSEKIEHLESGSCTDFTQFTSWIPDQILVLASLYVLAYVREIDENKRLRTKATRLKEISPIGTTFCSQITNALKTHISNLVAHSYRLYLKEMSPFSNINGAPMHMWGAYVQMEHIRVDKRSVHYAPCIYSNQIALGYLIASKSKVALINDVISASGEVVDQIIYIFQGDGYNHLRLLSQEEIDQLEDESEPMVVFGGYVKLDSASGSLNHWLEHLPCLILACDLFYPQFPCASDDLDFNSIPILPKEERLEEVFLDHIQVKGVSVSDPFLYCLSHTYTIGLGEVLKALREKKPSVLSNCFNSMQIAHPETWGIEWSQSLGS